MISCVVTEQKLHIPFLILFCWSSLSKTLLLVSYVVEVIVLVCKERAQCMCQDYLSHERWNQAPKGLGEEAGLVKEFWSWWLYC